MQIQQDFNFNAIKAGGEGTGRSDGDILQNPFGQTTTNEVPIDQHSGRPVPLDQSIGGKKRMLNPKFFKAPFPSQI